MRQQIANWSRQRLIAVATTVLVVVLFVAANVHLVMVSFASMPACVAPATDDQPAMLRVAKPAC